MNETLILLSTCTAAGLGAAAIVSLCADVMFRDKVRIQQRLLNEFHPKEKQNPQKSPLFRDLKMLQSTVGSRYGWRDWWNRFSLQVEQSGSPFSPPQIAGFSVTASLVSAAITYALMPKLLITVGVAVLGLIAPFVAVEYFRQRRRVQLCQQLPDAFDQMRRFVRAGQPLMSAMQQIATDFPPPLADEFAMCCQQQDLGLSQSFALQDLARRINIMELQLFVVAALVQRDIGGNSAEMLGNLSTVVRQRFRLASRVKSSTAEGRMQAVVLAMLPIFAGGIMMFLNAEYTQVLLDRPKLLAGLVTSEVIGVMWIRRIVHFDY